MSALGRLAVGGAAAVVVAGLAACRPDLGPRESLVTRTHVVAVRFDPPEAAPGAEVVVTPIVASPDGPVAAPRAELAFCATAKLLTENGATSAACLRDAVQGIGIAEGAARAALPPRACFVFGPETASAELRPRDPDVTGGFFQPVRVRLVDAPEIAFGFVRLGCKLASAPADLARDFAARYRANANPELVALEVPQVVARGARVTLRAAWTPSSAETYVAYDVRTQLVVDRRESLRASWLVTAGDLDEDRTGRAEDDPASDTTNVWTAPDAAGMAHVWVVLRDARGGVDARAATVEVR